MIGYSFIGEGRNQLYLSYPGINGSQSLINLLESRISLLFNGIFRGVSMTRKTNKSQRKQQKLCLSLLAALSVFVCTYIATSDHIADSNL